MTFFSIFLATWTLTWKQFATRSLSQLRQGLTKGGWFTIVKSTRLLNHSKKTCLLKTGLLLGDMPSNSKPPILTGENSQPLRVPKGKDFDGVRFFHETYWQILSHRIHGTGIFSY